MFNIARLKLTFWYVLFVIVISSFVSVLFYAHASNVLERQYTQFSRRVQQAQQQRPPGRGPRIELTGEDLETARSSLIRSIILINTGLAVITALGSWILAGATLKPIRISMEKQKRFVSHAAHELRTPITAMKTALEVTLMDTHLPKKVRAVLEENKQDLTQLEQLSEGLLTITRHPHNANTIVNNTNPTMIYKPIQTAIRQMNPLAKSKSITLTTRGTFNEEDTMVAAQEHEIIELITILLDNAIAHTPVFGSINVAAVSSKDQITITVTDTGSGIPEGQEEQIFEVFYRANHSRPGHGLGLAIARSILESYGGTIFAKNCPDEGTSFICTLPLVR
ncbi:MAG: sensor histidine kinase [Patescibacteria group bacterium]